ncbi:MAG TPA: hypothetical protein VGX23_19435 [Actinocrinis sp.]|nr:hypothetical protein [Actinocrinis sp.]
MTRKADRYVWDPAADDRELAQACMSLRGGRFFEARAVLSATRRDFALRAHRSLVLASVAADSDVIERWVAEEPDPDAVLLAARTAAIRALRAADLRDPRATDLAALAQAGCLRAADLLPDDPTPWAALLAVARLEPHNYPGPEGLEDVLGPWEVMRELWSRDPLHREGHHRLLAYFFARYDGSHAMMWDVAWWVRARAPAGSELLLLPLVAQAEHYRSRAGRPGTRAAFDWDTQEAKIQAAAVYDDWFPHRDKFSRFTPVLDLSYLGHALCAGGMFLEARPVLQAMGPYATTMPWSLFGEPAEHLSRARSQVGLAPLQH